MKNHPAPDPSWSLIGRAAAGDGTARDQLTRAYLPLVREYLDGRWRGTPLSSEVEDAVQETFIELLREGGALGRVDPDKGNLCSMLLGMCRNVAARYEERAGKLLEKGRPAGSILDAIHSREPSLSMQFDKGFAMQLVGQAAAQMRENAAAEDDAARARVELLELRFAQGLPIREIAKAWNMEAALVHRAYARARSEFLACLRAVVAEQVVRQQDSLDAEVDRVLDLLG